jgi:hypothetical protein
VAGKELLVAGMLVLDFHMLALAAGSLVFSGSLVLVCRNYKSPPPLVSVVKSLCFVIVFGMK